MKAFYKNSGTECWVYFSTSFTLLDSSIERERLTSAFMFEILRVILEKSIGKITFSNVLSSNLS